MMDIKKIIFGIVSGVARIPIESINEDTKIPADKTKAVFDALAPSCSFCIPYTGAGYTVGQIVEAIRQLGK